jgi:hypothetical protein
MDMTKFTSLQDAGFTNLKGVLDDLIKRAKDSKTSDITSEAKSVASAATMTFTNGSIKADIFQQGSGNAGRNINHGNVTDQSAGRDTIHGNFVGRDWVNRQEDL